MIMTIFIFVGKAAGSAALDAIKNAVLGIEYQDVTVEDWAKTAALAIFAGQSLRPELSFEKKAELRFGELQQQIDEVKQDITNLKGEMAAFKWKVASQFYDEREETLWQEMLNLDTDANDLYDDLVELGGSALSLEKKRQKASELANGIITKLRSQVTKTRARMLGEDVGAGGERVRGFIEVWREQALRDADAGWDKDRLSKIYG